MPESIQTLPGGYPKITAMPPLSGQECLRDFIACITHAILINAINGSYTPHKWRITYA
jgi:hypothetical protein